MNRVIDFPADISQLNPDPWTQPFWDAAREHRLVVARCTNCATLRPMPPGPMCWECDEQRVDWITLSGTGTIHTYTVVRNAPLPDMEAPFVIAVIALDGAPGVRLMTNIVGIDVDDVRVGQPVTVVWDDVTDDVTIPRFEPRNDIDPRVP